MTTTHDDRGDGISGQQNKATHTHTRKQGHVEIYNFPISLRDGLVIDVSFECEFKGSSSAPGG